MENAFYNGKNSNPDMAVLLTSLSKTMNTNNIEETELK